MTENITMRLKRKSYTEPQKRMDRRTELKHNPLREGETNDLKSQTIRMEIFLVNPSAQRWRNRLTNDPPKNQPHYNDEPLRNEKIDPFKLEVERSNCRCWFISFSQLDSSFVRFCWDEQDLKCRESVNYYSRCQRLGHLVFTRLHDGSLFQRASVSESCDTWIHEWVMSIWLRALFTRECINTYSVWTCTCGLEFRISFWRKMWCSS